MTLMERFLSSFLFYLLEKKERYINSRFCESIFANKPLKKISFITSCLHEYMHKKVYLVICPGIPPIELVGPRINDETGKLHISR